MNIAGKVTQGYHERVAQGPTLEAHGKTVISEAGGPEEEEEEFVAVPPPVTPKDLEVTMEDLLGESEEEAEEVEVEKKDGEPLRDAISESDGLGGECCVWKAKLCLITNITICTLVKYRSNYCIN